MNKAVSDLLVEFHIIIETRVAAQIQVKEGCVCLEGLT